MLKKIIRPFFYKNGVFSKTAFFLTIATVIVLCLYPFQTLFVGTVFAGWWTVPAFNVSAGVTILFTLATLYVTNHNRRLNGKPEVVTPEELADLKVKVEAMVKSMTGDSDDD